MDPLLAALSVPAEYASAPDALDPDVRARLDRWRASVATLIAHLRAELDRRAADASLPVDEAAAIAATIAPFAEEDEWAAPEAQRAARALLETHIEPPAPALLRAVLAAHVKPAFAANPHPLLDSASARRLPRAAGGPLAAQDYYEAQAWKERPALASVVAWCVRCCPEDAFDELWPLLVPPVMTLLDDYETRYKIAGVHIASSLIERAPPALLRRTGLDALLSSSLAACLTHLHTAHTPALLRTAVPAALLLTARTTAPRSAARSAALCALLGDGLVGGVWAYAARDRAAVRAATDVLPPVLRALGVGSVRYLKALVPQLTHALALPPRAPDAAQPDAGGDADADADADSPAAAAALQLSSLHALAALTDVCAVRMHRWKGAVLDAVARCWVALADESAGAGARKAAAEPKADAGADSRGASDADAELRGAMRDVVRALARACPSVVEDECARLRALDGAVFDGLVGPAVLGTDVSVSVSVNANVNANANANVNGNGNGNVNVNGTVAVAGGREQEREEGAVDRVSS